MTEVLDTIKTQELTAPIYCFRNSYHLTCFQGTIKLCMPHAYCFAKLCDASAATKESLRGIFSSIVPLLDLTPAPIHPCCSRATV